MAIFTDAIGNKFLGDCIWANHDINYPTTKFLQTGVLHSAIATELNDLFVSIGFTNIFIDTQANFNSYVNSNNYSPTGVGRFSFRFSGISDFTPTIGFTWDTSLNAYSGAMILSPNSIRVTSSGVRGFFVSGSPTGFQENGYSISGLAGHREVQWFACVDSKSLSIGFLTSSLNLSNPRFQFFHTGELLDVNTNFNYYSANQINKMVAFRNDFFGGHYIATGQKQLLTTGDAQYPVVCADGQNPTSQWATDFYVFDNNATLGYPAIGRVRNLLLAQGTYTRGKPVKIQGTAMPDAGFNRWLPVGTFSGKTVLMRCYSSVDI